MNSETPREAETPEDPLVRGARREALVVFGVWLAALAWTVGYCTTHAYRSPAEPVEFVLGFPSWVFWGILLPWAACVVIGCCFSLGFMQDHDLERESIPGIAGESAEDAADA